MFSSHNVVANGGSNRYAEDKRSNEVREGGHQQSDLRAYGAGGDHGGYDVARVVDTVEEIEDQREDDEKNQ